MLRKGFLCAALCLGLAGCEWKYTQNSQSEAKHEWAEVVEAAYLPSGHGEGTSPGFDSDGNLIIGFTNVTIPDKWVTVFRCQHGKFAIDGKETWEKVNVGDVVDVSYIEKYEDTYLHKGGQEILVGRSLLGYHYLGCEIVNTAEHRRAELELGRKMSEGR